MLWTAGLTTSYLWEHWTNDAQGGGSSQSPQHKLWSLHQAGHSISKSNEQSLHRPPLLQAIHSVKPKMTDLWLASATYRVPLTTQSNIICIWHQDSLIIYRKPWPSAAATNASQVHLRSLPGSFEQCSKAGKPQKTKDKMIFSLYSWDFRSIFDCLCDIC